MPILRPTSRSLRATLGSLATASLMIALHGCGSNASNTNDNTATTNGNTHTKSAASGAALKIAVIPKGLAHSFWQSVKKGADEAGQKYNAQIIWNGPASEAEVSRQVQIVEDAITQKVDGIVLAPIDRKALVGAIDNAAKAKIPLVIFDSDADTKNRISFVATDNYKGGQLGARRLAEIIGKKGSVGMVPVQPSSQSTGDRERGFEDTMKKEFPAIKVIKAQYGYSDQAKSLAAAEDMLTAHPELVGIFGPNESSAVGSLNALSNRKMNGKIKLVGFDSSKPLTDALTSGDIDSLVVQNPTGMGFEGVKAIIDSKAGRKVAPRIDTGVTVITKAAMNTPANQQLLGLK